MDYSIPNHVAFSRHSFLSFFSLFFSPLSLPPLPPSLYSTGKPKPRPATDLWGTDAPASDLNGTAYEEVLFGRRAVDIIEQHDTSIPLFLYYAFHTSCVGWNQTGHAGGEPDTLQPDRSYYDRFPFIADPDRRVRGFTA